MDSRIRSLIDDAVDGTISLEDFAELQDLIETNLQVRTEYLSAVNLAETLTEIATGDQSQSLDTPITARTSRIQQTEREATPSSMTLTRWTLVATLMITVGATAYWLGHANTIRNAEQDETPEAAEESDTVVQPELLMTGHATLRRVVDMEWSADTVRRREGDVLPNGWLKFDGGLAEIDFFSGASLVVEGPASLEIESDWSVRVRQGRLRANVPPAARGFVVKVAESEIVDLGTEFALDVENDRAQVEVINGEVKLRGGSHDGKHLVTGERQLLSGPDGAADTFRNVSTSADLDRRRKVAGEERFNTWREHSKRLRHDPRLIAYFPIADACDGRTIRNHANRGSHDAMLTGPVETTAGRFGGVSTGLEFDRPGARVRTLIDGEFSAFTFECWVRIDSLDHRYNALFMADSYQTGEPHWQIRDDGCLMFSVMVDDTDRVEGFSELENQMVTRGGRHRIYLTEPVWDISKSGQWFHLAATYSPGQRMVTQYVNGQVVAREPITDNYFVDSLRIGPSEIGNWGQPLRTTPKFAVRNLNGVIDEMMIFDAVLTANEIREHFEQGTPPGY